MIPASTIASSRASIAVLARLQLTPENTFAPYIFTVTKAYALLLNRLSTFFFFGLQFYLISQ